MIKKSLTWLYSFTTYLLWAVVIVVTCVVLGVRYLVLPHAHEYKDTIAQKVSLAAGQKITIGDLKAGWEGLYPRLDLYQVALYDGQGRTALSLDHIETSLSWLTLVLGEPRLSQLVIHQPQLTIRRERDGVIYVAGISMSGPARPEFPNWLLRQSRVDVLDASVIWQDDMRTAPPLELQKLTLQLRSPPWESLLGHHRFGLRATPATEYAQPIDLRGNLWGKDVSHPEQWHGTIYGKLEGLDIAAWRAWVDYPFNLRQGHGATQFWLAITGGHVDSVTADVLLSNVRTHFGKQAPEASLQDLSGRLIWKRLDNGQELRAEKLSLTMPAALDIRNGTIRVKTQKVSGKDRIEGEVQLDEARLEQLTAFSGYLPVSSELRQTLGELSPQGQVQKVALTWSGDAEHQERYAIRGNFSGLGINAYRDMPGFSNLSGSLDANQAGGTLSLDAHNALLDLKKVLRWPIPADNLSGQVAWANRDNQLVVKLNNMAISNPHIAGTITASYHHNASGNDEIDLVGKFGHADGKFAHLYYPTVLSKDTLHWLDTSILAGRGENISVVVRGKLDQFPWPDSKHGLFQVKAELTDGMVDYAEGWPKIEDIRLDLLFQGNRMELNAKQGHLLGNQINRAKVVIPALDAQHPVLEITGEVQGPTADTINFINNSPLLSALDRFTEGMQGSGKGKLSLGLRIPLDTNGVGTKIKGSYLVSDGTLKIADKLPPLDHINGRLDFTEATLNARNLNAQLYGSPAQISFDGGKDGLLRITAQGRINDAAISKVINLPLTDRLHGSTDWNAAINLRQHQVNLTIQSTLVGLSSSLPPPFDKGSLDALPLLIEKKPQDDKQDLITFSLGSVASAAVLRREHAGVMGLDRGEINFGGKAEIPSQAGIYLKGSITHFDADQWQGLFGDTTGGERNFTFSGANLSFGTLDVFDRRIHELKLNAKSMVDGWQAEVQSREITGNVQWLRSGHGKVVAQLKSLIMPSAAPAKLSDADAQPKKDPEYPALEITADEFEIKQKKVGRMELVANYQTNDWNIEKLRISNPDSTLTVDGEWHNWKRKPNTRLNLAWNITDLGKTLQRFGYPDTIKGGEADLSGQLKWPGSPHEFTVNGLSGNLQLDARHGQFLKIQPGVGRLFSVLSLQNLPRRLTFDFRDVFSAGFTFDKISANARLNQGIMRSDDFMMEGPTAKVAISGETDLNRETQNLHIKVTPSISDSLSLAAFAGGPAVGAAAWVAQKILKDPLNKLAAYEYDITGTWADPQEVKSTKPQPAPAASPLGK